jgi:two-component system, OmpR family, phosphate regulon sensor histidine kinase PhoR
MMLGLSEEQARLATIEDIPSLFAADCADREQCFGLRAALEGRTVRTELMLQLQQRPQSRLVFSVTATPMRDGTGHVVGAVAVVRDVTQQKVLDQLRIDFISAAAHELKTPITTLKGYAQLALMRLRSNIDRPRLQRALESIDLQADRVVHIVQKLMDATRMQVGLLDLEAEVIDLAVLVRECVNQSQAMSPRHQLSLVAPPTIPIMADRLRIKHAMQNILDNAIKYSPAGGAIEIRLETRNGEALLTVQDHGVGIPSDKQALIFEPWYQAHEQSIGDIGGMGLGLSISREIVERHGGRMWCDSAEGAGSLFGFTLPLLDR